MSTMGADIKPGELKRRLDAGEELALLDVREAGEFAAGHCLFAVSAPLSRFEHRLLNLVPSTRCPVVLVDDGRSGRSSRAAQLCRSLGYSQIYCLSDGIVGWAHGGLSLFEGLNVPSKVFGEIVETALDVPHLTAGALRAWQQADRRILLLDGRPFDEHAKMNIPGSICLPNGELPTHARRLLPDDSTPIVVHCAGRTRSIIGAQILRELDLPNPVYALENGTQGWVLAGFVLEHGSTRRADAPPSGGQRQAMREEAYARSRDWGIPWVDPATLQEWITQQKPTTYCFDVRSESEWRADRIAEAIHAPGGQLIQATDQWMAVRAARVVLVDDAELRAVVVARWLRRMGWDAHVLGAYRSEWRISSLPEPATPAIAAIEPASLDPGSVILDCRNSMAFRRAHINGARWTLRCHLPEAVTSIACERPIAVCGEDPIALAAMVRELAAMGFRRVVALAGGPELWSASGLELVSSPADPPDAAAIDFVFFTHDRHAGNLEAARQYLAWETGLVVRLDQAERQAFRL